MWSILVKNDATFLLGVCTNDVAKIINTAEGDRCGGNTNKKIHVMWK